MRSPRWELVSRSAVRVTIRDVGPWSRFPTVTNGAEAVVDELVASGLLGDGQRRFYFDSEGACDEIVVARGKFVEFRAGAST